MSLRKWRNNKQKQTDGVLKRYKGNTEKKPYKCKYCDKCFSQSSNCRTHERIHKGETPHKCKHCDKCFTYPSQCKEHELIHTRDFQCTYCDKRFSRLLHCKEHERIHTGEKPHKCKYCDRHFTQPSTCRKHERIHTGEKPYQCKYCDKCFRGVSDRNRHERIHTGGKPYQCKCCDIKHPTQLFNCKKHEQIHRRVKPNDMYKDEGVHSGETEPQLLSSSAEHTANQLNTFSCWICQEELSSQELLMEHYDNHMILE